MGNLDHYKNLYLPYYEFVRFSGEGYMSFALKKEPEFVSMKRLEEMYGKP